MRTTRQAVFTGRATGALWLVLAMGWTSPAWSCPYSIRSVGFSGWRTPPLHVYCLVTGSTPNRKQVTHAFEQASDMVLFDSNVEAQVVDVDKEADHPAVVHARKVGVRRFPVLVLASGTERAMVLDVAGVDRADEEAIQSGLERVVWSDARADVADHIVRHWCVVLVAEGTDGADNARVERAIAAAAMGIRGFTTVLGETVGAPPHVVRIAAGKPDEAVLLWSLGLDTTKRPKAHVAVLFGRGRTLRLVLAGDEVTEDALLGAFRTIGENCACATAEQLLGQPPIPLRWGEDRQTQVRQVLKVDEEQMRADVLSTWSPGSGGRDAASAVQGYVEVAMPVPDAGAGPESVPDDVPADRTAAPDASAGAPAVATQPAPTSPGAPAAAPSPVSGLEQQTGRALLVAIGIMVAVLAVAGVVLAVRARRRA